ncbi:MAG: hypothetical protein BGO49_13490 [Planctomycetales bacterium 71-10]|nr:MAG: hypothetical protein BGO49_13490 [Planctomycetales bacterium 71-10]
MTESESLAFPTQKDLDKWLKANHARERELWVRIFKKDSGTPSVSWQDCVIVCLAWGWIDGVKRPLDDTSFLQRLTPRRPKSSWSKKNREHADRLIAEGRMQPAGLVHVEAARADGRWEHAYAGSAEMELPEDFLRMLDAHPVAKAFFATLKRAQVYSIYYRLQSAKRIETRTRRIEAILAALAEGRPPFPS